MNFRSLFTRVSLSAVLLVSSVTFAVKVPTSTPNFDLNVAFLLQMRAQAAWDGDTNIATAGAGAGPGAAPYGTVDTDFYIRRIRLIASGYAFQKFSFYLMFDTPNFGIRGNYTGSTFVQDMHIGYEPFKELAIEAGFIYIPFNYLAVLSSSSTSSIEKGTAILFYNNARGLRETGIQVRALLLDKLLYLRGGVFEGLHGRQNNQNGAAVATTDAPAGNPSTVNPNGRPLLAGMARLNLIGGENGYSFPSIYLDGKSHVSIGVGGQFQGKGSNTPITRVGAGGARTTTNAAVNDYVAYSGDVFADFALPADTEAVLMVDAERFDWGSGSDKTGNGIAAEAGFRIGEFEPQVNGYWFNSESHQSSFLKFAGGLNWFIDKHNTKLQLEFIHQKNGVNFGTSPAVHMLLAQFQFYY